MEKKTKVAVTGGLGFIGHHLVNKLVEDNYDVLVIDNLSTGKKENKNPRARYLIKDINDIKPAHLQGAKYVFHLAALLRVPYSILKPAETNYANANGTLNVLLCARGAKAEKFIYSASSSAYGNQKKLPLHEEMAPDPLSPYALQKLVGEYYCKFFYQFYGLPTVCLRYFNVYGPEQDEKSSYTGVITLFKKAKKQGKKAVIFGDGEQSRDFTYVSDVVKANMLAAVSPKTGKGEIINVAGGGRVTINKIAELVGVEVEHREARPGDVRHTKGDFRKIKKMLGWKPEIGIDKGMKMF